MFAYHRLLLVILVLSIASPGFCAETNAAPKRRPRPAPARPEPTIANFAYGHESPRQVFDFWQAESDRPTPVVLLIHGGGWRNGDKTGYGTSEIKPFLDAGISVAAVNYRFINQAMKQDVKPPVKACLYDAARALQTIRSKAKEWNIDPKRIGATGGSAGACTSLWLAMHDDLAKPDSSDPVERESSRLTCAAVVGAQTSLDPVQLREWISNAEYGGHAFGFAGGGRKRPEEFALLMENREKVLPWIKEYSPIELVSKDDPPIYLDYPSQKSPPKKGQKEPDPNALRDVRRRTGGEAQRGRRRSGPGLSGTRRQEIRLADEVPHQKAQRRVALVADIADVHRRRNESTRNRWETMTAHRTRVTQLILAARGDAGTSLCILGAGNANDIDLGQLAQEFERIALIDLDDAALELAASRLSHAAHQRIELVGGFDLTGILPLLAAWPAGGPVENAELIAASDAATLAKAPPIGRFDVVASTCVLSQLIDSIYVAAPTEHPLRQQLVFAVRNRHLETLAALIEPGGAGVFVTDFVSTETAPELVRLSDEQIPAAAIRWINERNFFTGANPHAIRDYLQRLSPPERDIYDVNVVRAWRWDIGVRQLAASAITFRRG